MRTDNANRLADYENLYTRFQGNSEKKLSKKKKKNWLLVESFKRNQVIFILMGNFRDIP